jgi:hypothetical protein
MALAKQTHLMADRRQVLIRTTEIDSVRSHHNQIERTGGGISNNLPRAMANQNLNVRRQTRLPKSFCEFQQLLS